MDITTYNFFKIIPMKNIYQGNIQYNNITSSKILSYDDYLSLKKDNNWLFLITPVNGERQYIKDNNDDIFKIANDLILNPEFLYIRENYFKSFDLYESISYLYKIMKAYSPYGDDKLIYMHLKYYDIVKDFMT